MKRKSYDPECYKLAAHFLADVEKATAEDIDELAQNIQGACEDFCRNLEDETA